MKKRFTEEQIAYALKRHETCTKVGEICREMGVSDAAFYRWKVKYAGLDISGCVRSKPWKKKIGN